MLFMAFEEKNISLILLYNTSILLAVLEVSLFLCLLAELVDKVMGEHKRAFPDILEQANQELESVGHNENTGKMWR